jgi:hypothetical protein
LTTEYDELLPAPVAVKGHWNSAFGYTPIYSNQHQSTLKIQTKTEYDMVVPPQNQQNKDKLTQLSCKQALVDHRV